MVNLCPIDPHWLTANDTKRQNRPREDWARGDLNARPTGVSIWEYEPVAMVGILTELLVHRTLSYGPTFAGSQPAAFKQSDQPK